MDAGVKNAKEWVLDHKRRFFEAVNEHQDRNAGHFCIPSRCISSEGRTWKIMVHGDDCDEAARLILSAVQSYARHCPDALTAAESDLLGSTLQVLEDFVEWADCPYREELTATFDSVDTCARALLARAKGGAK